MKKTRVTRSWVSDCGYKVRQLIDARRFLSIDDWERPMPCLASFYDGIVKKLMNFIPALINPTSANEALVHPRGVS